MITDTLFIFGPGGTGKRSLDYLLKDDVVWIYPHILRDSGPHGTNDIRYAHHGLYDSIIDLFRVFDRGEASVDEEIGSWRQMIDEFGAVVYNNWRFPEYLYTAVDRTELLKEARNCLLDRNPQLEIFLKPENKLDG